MNYVIHNTVLNIYLCIVKSFYIKNYPMKITKVILAVVLLFVAFHFFKCDKKNLFWSLGSSGLKGNGVILAQDRGLSGFTKIETDGLYTLILSQGDEEKVVVETDENLQHLILANVDGGVLNLRMKNGASFSSSKKMYVYVTLKDIDRLKLGGVGSVETDGELQLDDLTVNAESVGETDIAVNCDNLDLENSSVGRIRLTGRANNCVINNSAVGALDADGLDVGKLKIASSGVGEVFVHASQEIDINHTGVGSLTYSGEAVIKNMINDGVGKVSKK